MNCRLNRCLLLAGLFLIAAGCTTKPSPLIEAASKGDTEKVQALLAQGADVNAGDIKGKTALMIAKKMGHKEIVRMLKQAGAKE